MHGSLIFEGADVAKLSTAERVQLGIALVPEGRHVFADLSVEANLELGFTRPGGSSFKERQAEVFDFFLGCWNVGRKKPVPCRGASSRCWRSDAR